MADSSLFAQLRDGRWFDRGRLAVIFLTLAVGLLSIPVFMVATGDGIFNGAGIPLGTDFGPVWAAGDMARQGLGQAVYDFKAHYAHQQTLYGENAPYLVFMYPPFHLIIAGALSALPYLWALCAWVLGTLVFYLLAVRMVLPSPIALFGALAFTGVVVNMMYGQNGFYTAGLMLLGLWLIDKRPIVAGICIGLLAYKPHFGVLFPLILLMERRFDTIAAAAATIFVLVGASAMIFGVDIWAAFAGSLHATRTEVLEPGIAGWQRLQSLFAFMRIHGAPLGLAYGVQAAGALLAAAACIWLWWREVPRALQCAGLASAALCISPYILDYDMMILGVALIFLVRDGLDRGFRAYEQLAIGVIGLIPFFYQDFLLGWGVPAGFLSTVAVLAMTLSRARMAEIPVAAFQNGIQPSNNTGPADQAGAVSRI